MYTCNFLQFQDKNFYINRQNHKGLPQNKKESTNYNLKILIKAISLIKWNYRTFLNNFKTAINA